MINKILNFYNEQIKYYQDKKEQLEKANEDYELALINKLNEPASELMLYPEPITVGDWLHWFYQELPLLETKHLHFTGLTSKNRYFEITIKLDALIKKDTKERRIMYYDPEHEEDVEITLDNYNLFNLCSATYQQYQDSKLIGDWEYDA